MSKTTPPNDLPVVTFTDDELGMLERIAGLSPGSLAAQQGRALWHRLPDRVEDITVLSDKGQPVTLRRKR